MNYSFYLKLYILKIRIIINLTVTMTSVPAEIRFRYCVQQQKLVLLFDHPQEATAYASLNNHIKLSSSHSRSCSLNIQNLDYIENMQNGMICCFDSTKHTLLNGEKSRSLGANARLQDGQGKWYYVIFGVKRIYGQNYR